MQHLQKKQALPCDRRHDPVTSHPFTVQCAPWTGRSVTIPQLLSIIQWSLSIHCPCKTTIYRFGLPHLLIGLVCTLFLRMKYHTLFDTDYTLCISEVQNKEIKQSWFLSNYPISQKKRTWSKIVRLIFQSISDSGKWYTTFWSVSWCANSSVVLNFRIAITAFIIYILLTYWQ